MKKIKSLHNLSRISVEFDFFLIILKERTIFCRKIKIILNVWIRNEIIMLL